MRRGWATQLRRWAAMALSCFCTFPTLASRRHLASFSALERILNVELKEQQKLLEELDEASAVCGEVNYFLCH